MKIDRNTIDRDILQESGKKPRKGKEREEKKKEKEPSGRKHNMYAETVLMRRPLNLNVGRISLHTTLAYLDRPRQGKY